MNLLRVPLTLALSCVASALIVGCDRAPTTSAPVALAPPGPSDLGPATGLSAPPEGASVFDLKYVAQTGKDEELQYHSFWGFGSAGTEAENDPFLKEVSKKAGQLFYVQNPFLKGRERGAVEYKRREVLAFYFDLNANGRLDENERLAPTRREGEAVQFITPDLIVTTDDNRTTFTRLLLQVQFYQGNNTPNCMWSPAAIMEGTALVNGREARLVLYASRPGGGFQDFGSSSYSLVFEKPEGDPRNTYIPRENLSSLILTENQFYHLTVEGQRSNGLPARVVLVKDTSPTGSFAMKLSSSNALLADIHSLRFQGVDDKTIFFSVPSLKEKLALPVGSYSLISGTASYGKDKPSGWEVSFQSSSTVAIKAGELCDLSLSQPKLRIRAIEEQERYNRQATESVKFKKGAKIYLEPTIFGEGHETFSRFRQPGSNWNPKDDRPPHVVITSAEGKEVLSKTMEYG